MFGDLRANERLRDLGFHRLGRPARFQFRHAALQHAAALQQALSLTIHPGAFRRLVRHVDQSCRLAQLSILIGMQQVRGLPEQIFDQPFCFQVELFQTARLLALPQERGEFG